MKSDPTVPEVQLCYGKAAMPPREFFMSLRHLKWIIIGFTSFLLTAVFSCSNTGTSIGNGEPFNVSLSMAGGNFVMLSGNSVDYLPGDPAEFVVTIFNSENKTWSDGYCLLLVDENGPQAYLGEKTFSLTPEEGLQDTVHTLIPEGAAEDLLEIFVRRYEKGAIIVTSNRPLEDWEKVLGDTAAAGAILDRFLHHATIIKLEGRSYRMHDRRESQKTPGTIKFD